MHLICQQKSMHHLSEYRSNQKLHVFCPGRPGKSLKKVLNTFPQHMIQKCITCMMPEGKAKKNLSPIAQSFWIENRRISNNLLCNELGYKLIYKNYRSGLKNCLLNFYSDKKII